MTFPGTYADAYGVEQVTWQVAPTNVFELVTAIRSATVRGGDFEGLEPDDIAAAGEAQLALDARNCLVDCTLSGEVPCVIQRAGNTVPAVLRFEVRPAQGHPVRVSIRIDGADHAASGDFFETALDALALAPADRLATCHTCLFSDYSPGGQSVLGMRCHRDDREQYLRVRDKSEYWAVPVTENVPEFYLCPEYEVRVPGTGYRG